MRQNPSSSRSTGPIGIGVLGCSDFARRRMLPAMTGIPSLRVTAVGSRHTGRSEQFTDVFGGAPVLGYQNVVDRADVEAVYIPLPSGLHVEWAARALRAGKHVLVEKPFAPTLEEAERLTRLADERKLVVMENFAFTHHSRHLAVRSMVEEGRIGVPRLITADFGIPPRPATDIRYRADLGGGALLDVGVYTVRAVQEFCGSELTVEAAREDLDEESGVDVTGQALLAAPELSARVGYGFAHSYRSSYDIWGSEGHISVGRAYTHPGDVPSLVQVESGGRSRTLEFGPEDQLVSLLTAFVGAVHGDSDPEPHRSAVLAQAALVEAVSLRSKNRPRSGPGDRTEPDHRVRVERPGCTDKP
ncbi:Gfo/Idh/MocA family protein [Nocardiopsis valliformis]|uniref:Gfo/Idh/MocA family protein n=1 Tax=Nocardiopsis valliformis TaxID=239974 RepID=UPI00034A3399|nr:Gfo/Idh/MocA family oxidoreductase [Nocardiopsis valliformis]